MTRPLSKTGSIAYLHWATAVKAVGEKWNREWSGKENPPWLENDLACQEAIRDSIRKGELLVSLKLITDWRTDWMALLDGARTK